MRFSEKSPAKLSIDLGVSPRLTILFVFVHGGALVIAIFVEMSLALRVLAVLLIGMSLYRNLMVHTLRRAPRAVVALTVNEDDTCALRHRGSEVWREGRLTDSWVHPLLVIVVVRLEGSRWSTGVLIAGDAVAAESFRRLRVRLRLRSVAA